jgi:hypothetical protein
VDMKDILIAWAKHDGQVGGLYHIVKYVYAMNRGGMRKAEVL